MVDDLRAAPSVATLKDLAALWGISFSRVYPRLTAAGSPERTLFRAVIEDREKRRFVLEKIPPQSYGAKMRIIGTLQYLAGNGISGIIPYMAGRGGQPIVEYEGGFWQLAPFVRGVALDRRKYLYEKWRADVLSRFLIELRDKSRGMPFFSSEKPFSIRLYIYNLVRQVEKHRIAIFPRIRKAVDFLEKDFMNVHDEMPVGFCHGDYHPLNIIWGKDDLKAVIDWEFSGMKPEIYDVANMIGCLGMEHPSSLAGELSISFIRRMREAGGFAEIAWEYLPEFIIALRFAWLSEWLRKDDAEMIALELDYMELLMENHGKWRRQWS